MHLRIRLLLLASWLMSGPCGAQELTIAVARLPFSSSFYVAEAEGYFADEGLKLKIEDCIFGRVCLKRLLDGEVPLATVGDTPIMLASFSSQSFMILATIGNSFNDSKLLVRRSAGIDAPRDLVGKRIGAITGTTAQYFLDTYLLYHGIDRRDVTVVSLLPDRAAAAIDKREVDAMAVFEPHAFAVANALGVDGKILASGRINHTVFNLVVDRRLVGARDADLVKMLRALDRAARFIRQQPLKAQAILRNRLKLDQDFIDWVWKDFEFDITLDQSLISVLESQSRWAAREGYAAGPAPPNYLQFLYTAPLSQVRPAAVSIIK